MSSEVLQVINRGDKPFTIMWGGQPYHLPPDGVPRAVPADAVKSAVGDWDAKDTQHDMKRMEWRKMLNVRYGLLNAPWYSDEPIETVGLKNDVIPEPTEPYTPAPEVLVESRYKYMHPNLPRLEVREFSGERIYTVIDDPDGDLVNGQRQAKANDASSDALLAAIHERDRQIDQLIMALTKTSPEAAAVLAAERNTAGVNLDPAGGAIHDPLAPTDDDATATIDAMSIMDDELGTKETSEVEAKPGPVAKKAASKKAAARPPVSVGDEL